jgi:hypothetical protein
MILKKSYEIDWVDAQFVFFLNKVSVLEKKNWGLKSTQDKYLICNVFNSGKTRSKLQKKTYLFKKNNIILIFLKINIGFTLPIYVLSMFRLSF